MDNAVVTSPNASLAQTATFAGRLNAMPARSKLSALIGVAALAGVVYAMTAWNSHGDYKVLYANLADKDGGAVIAQLSQMNVPYRMSEGGSAILVPAAQVHDLRLKMATAGLPKGAVSGFELMDSARFGQTQFQERLTFQRGLEGELTRSISLARRGAGGARPPRAAEPERLLSRAAEAERLGAADAAPRAHARPGADRRHRPPGLVERSRDEPEGGEHPRPERRAPDRRHRLRPGRRPRRAAAAVRRPDRGRLHQADHRAGRADRRRRQPARQRHRRRRLLADRGDLGRVQAEPGRRREHLDPQPADDRARRRRRRGARQRRSGRGVEPAADRRDRAAHRRLAAAAGRAERRCRRRRWPARGGDQLRGRQDGSRHQERDRQRQAAQRRGRRQQPQRHRRQGQDDAGAADERRDREADRAGARIDRLQQGARRFGQGHQRAVQGRPGLDRRDAVLEEPRADRPGPRRGAARRADAGRDPGLLRPGATGDEERVRGARRRSRRGPGTRIEAVVDDEPSYPPPALAAPAYLRQIEGAKALAKDNPAAVAGIVRGWVAAANRRNASKQGTPQPWRSTKPASKTRPSS